MNWTLRNCILRHWVLRNVTLRNSTLRNWTTRKWNIRNYSCALQPSQMARVARLAISSPKMSKAGAMGTLLAIKINFRRFLRFGDNAGDLGKPRESCKFPLITIYFRTQNTYRTPEFCWSAPVAGGPRTKAQNRVPWPGALFCPGTCIKICLDWCCHLPRPWQWL